MKGYIIEKPSPDAQLVYTDLPMPINTAEEVLVEIKAIALNPVDYKTIYDLTTPNGVRASAAPALDGLSQVIPGWDIAGIVREAGPNQNKFAPGAVVFGALRFPGHGKAYAEYVAADPIDLALKPAGISFEAAAATGIAALTAWQNLRHHFSVEPGQRILVTAPAGGVGHYAIQMARHLGAHVIALTNKKNADWVYGLGAHEVIDYHNVSLNGLDDLHLDLVLDVGGRFPPADFKKHLRDGAEIIFLPYKFTEAEEQMHKAAGLPVRYTGIVSSETDIETIASLLENKQVVPHIGQLFSFAQLPEALQLMKKGTVNGKIVITME